MLHTTARTHRYCGALATCAAIAVCAVYVTKSAAQSGKESQPQAANSSNAGPIYGVKIPAGYRDWKLISVAHVGGNLNDLRAKLANDVAIKAYGEGKVPFPDGTIIARLAYRPVTSEEDNKILRGISNDDSRLNRRRSS